MLKALMDRQHARTNEQYKERDRNSNKEPKEMLEFTNIKRNEECLC